MGGQYTIKLISSQMSTKFLTSNEDVKESIKTHVFVCKFDLTFSYTQTSLEVETPCEEMLPCSWSMVS